MTILMKNNNARRYYKNQDDVEILYKEVEDMYVLYIGEDASFYIHPDMVKEINEIMDEAFLQELIVEFEYTIASDKLKKFKLITDCLLHRK